MPAGVLDWYNTVQGFLGTLHEVLEDVAKEADAYDPTGAQKVRDIEYNWLSLIGIYKGIPPLLLDFYFNYFENKEFTKKSKEFAQSLNAVTNHFRKGATPQAIQAALIELTSGALKGELFRDGAIRSLLTDLHDVVKNNRLCLDLIRVAQQKAPSIVEFMQFISKGSKKQSQYKGGNSEL